MNGEAAMENSVQLPQNLKTRSTMIQQSLLGIYQKDMKSVPLTHIHTLVFMQHNPQYSRCGDDPSAHQQMNGYKWFTYTVDYYSATTKESLPLGRG